VGLYISAVVGSDKYVAGVNNGVVHCCFLFVTIQIYKKIST
jgi:hypothetical protein